MNDKIFKKLPTVLQTPAQKEFFDATVEQLFSASNTEKLQGYVGRKSGSVYDVTKDQYVSAPNFTRSAYQLEPIAYSLTQDTEETNQLFYQDFINYLKFNKGIVSNHDRLFADDYYSFSPPIDLDKFINFQNYIWMGNGMPVLEITGINDSQVESLIIGNQSFNTDDASGAEPEDFEFSSGMRVRFTDSTSYNEPLYVEGVGRSIDLVPDRKPIVITGVDDNDVSDILSGEARNTSDIAGAAPTNIKFTSGMLVTFSDSTSYTTPHYLEGIERLPLGGDLRGPRQIVSAAKSLNPDYITVERSSQYRNTWSNTNRWVHIDVIRAMIAAGGNLSDSDFSQDINRRGLRPIIEFQRGIELYSEFKLIESAVGTAAQTSYTLSEVLLQDELQSVEINSVIVDPSLYTVTYSETAPAVVVFDTPPALDADIKFFKRLFDSKRFDESNISPLFNLYDYDGVALNDTDKYPNSTFTGNTIFSYKRGTGLLIDPVLGFVAETTGFGEVNDLVFENALETNRYQYNFTNSPVVPISGYYFFKELNTSELKSIWKSPANQYKQRVVNRYLADGLTDTFTLSVTPVNQDVQVQVNGVTITSDDFTYAGASNSITLSDTPVENSIIELYTYTHDAIPTGASAYFEIPAALQNNPQNTDIVSGSWNDFSRHFITSIQNQTNFVGDGFGITNNFRDTQKDPSLGLNILQTRSPLLKSMLMSSSDELDILSSIQLSSQEYTRYKNRIVKYTKMLINEGFTPFDDGDTIPVSQWLDEVVRRISKAREFTNAFANTRMMAWSNTYKEESFVYSGVADFTLTEFVDLSDKKNAMYIYVNGEILTVDNDYVIVSSDSLIEVTITKALTFGDQVVFRLYEDFSPSHVPATPSKVGISGVSIPRIELDQTFPTPVDVIVGHDGSRTPVFGDYTDSVLLEFEKRIYNGILEKFRLDYDLPITTETVKPGYFRTTRWDRSEWLALSKPVFYKWATYNQADFRTNEYSDPVDPWSWNYSGVDFNGFILQGSWRSLFETFYDTQTPHITPWEMLGFSEKPTWWDAEYSAGPWANTHPMWIDIQAGEIKAGNRAGIDLRYARPNLIANHIPVDATGALKSTPLACIGYSGSNPSLEQQQAPWKYGDIGPVEHVWMSSETHPYHIAHALFLAKPADFGEKLWDPEHFVRLSIDRSQIVSDENGVYKRVGNQNLVVDGELQNGIPVVQTGYQVFVSSRLRALNKDVTLDFGDKVRSLDAKLGHKVSGFTNQETLRAFASGINTSSVSSNLLIPSENINVSIHTSPPVKEYFYGGVLVKAMSDGTYQILGYDSVNESFTYIPRITSPNDKKINVGGTPAPFTFWETGKQYKRGDIVKLNATFYQAIEQHQSTRFNSEQWTRLPALPTVGGITVTHKPVGTNTLSEYDYGTILTDAQSVFDFIVGYGDYLESEGFVFDNLNAEAGKINTWFEAGRDFLFWAATQWEADSTISLSPGANKITLRVKEGYPSNVERVVNGAYSILDQNGVAIDPVNTHIQREGREITCVPLVEGVGIFSFRVNTTETESIVTFDNTTKFDDIIYDPLFGVRQDRLLLNGIRTLNWSGKLEAGGYLITSDGLVPNFENLVNSIRYYHDTEADTDSPQIENVARHLIGYDEREYFNNLNLTGDNQYLFYQGLIREKGTVGALEKLQRSINVSQTDDVVFEAKDEWALRLGEYGATCENVNTEFLLRANEIRANTQLVELSYPTSQNQKKTVIETIDEQKLLFSFGDNTNYKTGLGFDEGLTKQELQIVTPNREWLHISAGATHTLAVAEDSTLWGWGDNTYSQINDSVSTFIEVPTQVVTGNGWAFVSAGKDHSLALKQDGTLWAWGRNELGQLGLGDFIDKDQPTLVESSEKQLIASPIQNETNFDGSGSNGTFVAGTGYTVGDTLTLSNGDIVTVDDISGGGATGPVTEFTVTTVNGAAVAATPLTATGGTGNDDFTLTPGTANLENIIDTWLMVSAGGVSSNGINTAGELYGWGDNSSGQAGIAVNPTGGTNLPEKIGTDTDWAFVSGSVAELSHGFAIKSDGTLWAWGSNEFGKTGLSTDTGNSGISEPAQVGSDTNWLFVSSGETHSLAIKNDFTLWSTGSNEFGKTGLETSAGQVEEFTHVPTISSDAISASAGTNHSIVVDNDKKVVAFGKGDVTGLNVSGNVTSPTLIPDITGVEVATTGDDYTVILRSQTQVEATQIGTARVTGISLVSANKSWGTPPNITIVKHPQDVTGPVTGDSGDKRVAKAIAVLDNSTGKISRIDVTDPGAGYSLAPRIYINQTVGDVSLSADSDRAVAQIQFEVIPDNLTDDVIEIDIDDNERWITKPGTTACASSDDLWPVSGDSLYNIPEAGYVHLDDVDYSIFSDTQLIDLWESNNPPNLGDTIHVARNGDARWNVYKVEDADVFKFVELQSIIGTKSFNTDITEGLNAEVSIQIDADGTLSNATLVNGGQGVADDASPTTITSSNLSPSGEGSGGVLAFTVTSNEVTSVDSLTEGSGYGVPFTQTIEVPGAVGSRATLNVTTNTSGQIASATVNSGGSGYTNVRQVPVPGGSNGILEITPSGGTIQNVRILNSGSNYSGTRANQAVSNVPAPSPSIVSANVSVVASNSITASITIGLFSDVTFDRDQIAGAPQGYGMFAINYKLLTVSVTNPGLGYYADNGTGNGTITISNISGLGGEVVLDVVNHRISGGRVTEPGNGYFTDPASPLNPNNASISLSFAGQFAQKTPQNVLTGVQIGTSANFGYFADNLNRTGTITLSNVSVGGGSAATVILNVTNNRITSGSIRSGFGGAGYTAGTHAINSLIPVDTSTASATIQVDVNDNGGITNPRLINRGKGYFSPGEFDITISGVSGSGARLKFSTKAVRGTDGKIFSRIESVVVTRSGSGYGVVRNLLVDAPIPSSAPALGQLEISIDNFGKVNNVRVLSSGQGYGSASQILLESPSFTVLGTGAIVSYTVDSVTGGITNASVVNPGVNYLPITQSTLVIPGDNAINQSYTITFNDIPITFTPENSRSLDDIQNLINSEIGDTGITARIANSNLIFRSTREQLLVISAADADSAASWIDETGIEWFGTHTFVVTLNQDDSVEINTQRIAFSAGSTAQDIAEAINSSGLDNIKSGVTQGRLFINSTFNDQLTIRGSVLPVLINNQDESDYNNTGDNGSFTSGTGYQASVKSDQSETNYSGSFAGGSGYNIDDVITMDNGTTVNVDAISTDTQLVAAQDETDFDGTPPKGSFVAGTGYTGGDTLTLSNGDIVTVGTVGGGGEVLTFTVTTVNGTAADGATLTSSGAGNDDFELTPGTANLENVGDATEFTVLTSGLVSSSTITLNQTSVVDSVGDPASGSGFELDVTVSNLDMPVVTLSNNATVLADELVSGEITEFTIQTTGIPIVDSVLSQISTDFSGSGFTLTPDSNNTTQPNSTWNSDIGISALFTRANLPVTRLTEQVSGSVPGLCVFSNRIVDDTQDRFLRNSIVINKTEYKYELVDTFDGDWFYVLTQNNTPIQDETFGDNISLPVEVFYSLRYSNTEEYTSSEVRQQLLAVFENRTPTDYVWIDKYDVTNEWVVRKLDTGDIHRQAGPLINSTLFDNVFVYDIDSQDTIVKLPVFDPYKDILPGPVGVNLTYKTFNDPARYNNSDNSRLIDTSNIFTRVNVGETWWDLSTVAYYLYEQGTNRYRRNNWGRIVPGSSIDVYEWVRSTTPPDSYTGEGSPKNTTDFVSLNEINPISQRSQTFYYFWVKGLTTTPSVPGRTLSVSSVSNLIQNPLGQGFSWFAPISTNGFVFASSDRIFADSDTVLQINYRKITDNSNEHTQWELAREDDLRYQPNEYYWDRITDSLSGITDKVFLYGDRAFGESINFLGQVSTVGDLPPSSNDINDAYLVGITLYVWDGTQWVDQSYRFLNNYSDALVSSDDPFRGYLLVPDADLNNTQKYGVSIRPRQTMFVDMFTARRIFVDKVNELLAPSRLRDTNSNWNSGYNTTTLWEWVDWWADGFDRENASPSRRLNSLAELNSITDAFNGEVILVLGPRRSLYIYDEQNAEFELIYREKTRLQLKSDIYTKTFSLSDAIELRELIRALRAEVFCCLTNNRVFFAMLNYVFSEQEKVDWAFKTTYTSIVQGKQLMTTDPFFTNEATLSINEYIREALPYHTQVRQFITVKSPEREDLSGSITETVFNSKMKLWYDRFRCSLSVVEIRIAKSVLDFNGYVTLADDTEIRLGAAGRLAGVLSKADERIPLVAFSGSNYSDYFTSTVPVTSEELEAVSQINTEIRNEMRCFFEGVIHDGYSLSETIPWDFLTWDSSAWDGSIDTITTDVEGSPKLVIKPNQTQADYDGSTSRGTFSGGSGYAVGDRIILTNRAIINVDNADGSGTVTAFTVVKIGNEIELADTLEQSNIAGVEETTGTGTGFDITLGTHNITASMLEPDPVEEFTGTGTQKTFTMSNSFLDIFLEVIVDGVTKVRNVDYFFIDRDIFFIDAPDSGSSIKLFSYIDAGPLNNPIVNEDLASEVMPLAFNESLSIIINRTTP